MTSWRIYHSQQERSILQVMLCCDIFELIVNFKWRPKSQAFYFFYMTREFTTVTTATRPSRALRSEYKQVSALTFLGSLLHLELAHKVTLHRIDIRTKETNHPANNHHRKNWLENVLAIQIKQPCSSDFGIVGCLTPQESEKFKGPLDCDALDLT